jgi:hypothetical protein
MGSGYGSNGILGIRGISIQTGIFKVNGTSAAARIGLRSGDEYSVSSSVDIIIIITTFDGEHFTLTRNEIAGLGSGSTG